MEYQDERRADWVRRFVASTTKDRGQLQQALRSVPDTAWTAVRQNLLQAISEASDALEGQAVDAEEGREANAPIKPDATLMMKRELIEAERRRRAADGQR